MADQAYVTLATNDNYAKGAMVLGRSLRNHNTTKQLVVLIGPHVAEPCRAMLSSIYDEVCVVDILDSRDTVHLALMKRPDLGVTFTKLHCWTLTHYTKCVFMDADTLVLSNIDELFEREELSAAPDPGWPDCFNSGVFVFKPSNETYRSLMTHCTENGSFDGGDQGVLNSFFNTWSTADISKHLPFIYNLSSIAIYTYLPAFKQYGHEAKVVHFLGKVKPWNYSYDTQTGKVKGHTMTPGSGDLHPDFLVQWWNLYSSGVLPALRDSYGDALFCSQRLMEMQCSALRDSYGDALFCSQRLMETQCSALRDSYGDALFCSGCTEEEVCDSVIEIILPPPPPQTPQVSSEERRQRWEGGQADYMGADSFESIQRKLDCFLK